MTSYDTSDFERSGDIREKTWDVVWRNVGCRNKEIYRNVFQRKQNEESDRLEKIRINDNVGYLALINDICTIKTSNTTTGAKMRCYIPSDYFEKRIAYKTMDKDEDRRTSLEVHLPTKSEDSIVKQAKYRRSLAFKKYLNNQEIENILNIPFIEEDAADLFDLMNMATNKQTDTSTTVKTAVAETVKLPYILELEEKPKAGILVSCYVKDHILKLPMLMPNAARIRELYTNCIIKDVQLNRLYTRRTDMLPKDLIDYIADFGANNETDNNPKIIKDEIADRDQFFHTSINVYASDILRELEIESLEFAVFIKPCYILHFSQVIPDIVLLNLQESLKIESIVIDLIDELDSSIFNPISKSRRNLMGAMMAGNQNPLVTHIFIENLSRWLSALSKGLFSFHNPVREECCYCVGFLFTQSKLVYDLLNFYSSEFVYEIVSIIFKAIEHYHTSFEFFYSLIGYIMDGCPLVSILQCICDKGPISSNYEMRKRWPKFIVFACKHWPNETFIGGQFILKKIQDLLERSFLHPVTYKTSKMALAYIGRRFEKKSMNCTHWVLNKCGPSDDI